MEDIFIREAEIGDAELLASIIRISNRDVAVKFGLTTENAPTHPSNCVADWIVSAMEKDIRYHILEYGGKPVGCAALERANPDACYLERLSVLPEHRNRGLGTALVKHLAGWAKDAGARRIEIGIIAEHAELLNWYLKLGFKLARTAEFDHLPFNVAFLYSDL